VLVKKQHWRAGHEEHGRGGKFELFTTTSHHDSTAQNPEWLGKDPAEAEELAKLVE